MDQLFEAAANGAREHRILSMPRPVPLEYVCLLWLNDSVLGVYANQEDARKVAAEVRATSALSWDEGPVDRWNGWTKAVTLAATMSVERRRIG